MSAEKMAGQRQQGVSFIEILAVVFIIAVLATTVVTLLPEKQQLRPVATSVMGFLSAVRDRAIFSGQTYGVEVSQLGLNVWFWDGNAWLEPVTAAEADNRLKFSNPVTQRLQLNGEAVVLQQQLGHAPHLIYLPDGQAAAFTWQFGEPEQSLILQGDMLGRMHVN